MPRSVSVPKKTLEHLSSQYVSYLYRSKAALWWPASGQDIDVRWLPARPGKAAQLELKTTTVVRPGVHDVIMDLGHDFGQGDMGFAEKSGAPLESGRVLGEDLVGRHPVRDHRHDRGNR